MSKSKSKRDYDSRDEKEVDFLEKELEKSTEIEDSTEVVNTTKGFTNLPLITLEVFCKLSGKKPDQIAGFHRYAATRKLGPLTVPEWKKELIAFEYKPMQ